MYLSGRGEWEVYACYVPVPYEERKGSAPYLLHPYLSNSSSWVGCLQVTEDDLRETLQLLIDFHNAKNGACLAAPNLTPSGEHSAVDKTDGPISPGCKAGLARVCA